MKRVPKKILVALSLCIGILAIFFFSGGLVKNDSESGGSLNSFRTRDVATSDVRSSLSLKTGIREHDINECVFDILQAFESKDKALISEKVRYWMEHDYELFMSSLEAFDNLDLVYGYEMEVPWAEISQFMYDKEGGEVAMDRIGLLSRTSNTINEITAGVLRVWGRDQLDGALNYLKENPNFDNGWAVSEIGRDQVLNNDPRAAIEKASMLAKDQERFAAIAETAYAVWVKERPEEFANYMNSVEDWSLAKRAVQTYAVTSSADDPQLALEWANAIPNDDLRDAAVTSVAIQMANQDPEAFQKYLSENSFESEHERAYFLGSVATGVEAMRNYDPNGENFDTAKWLEGMIEFNNNRKNNQGD